nr:hypothetical protein [Schwartzia sp. (in: firmicutes)]
MRFTEADKRFARKCVAEAERAQSVIAELWGTPEALARRWREYRRGLAYWRAFEAVGKRRRKQRERELNRAATVKDDKIVGDDSG